MNLHGLDDVIGAAQLGEEWAWSRLYDTVAPGLMGYFRARGASNPEDLVGETFVQIARNLPSFEGDLASFQSWVFMIAHHRLSNHRRRFARRPETLTDKPLDDGRTSPSAEDDALEAMGSVASLKMLTILTTDQRNVIALRYVVDLSVDETAEIIGTSPGAIKQLTRRALERLRKEISQEAITQ